MNCIFYSASLRHVRMFICYEYIAPRLVCHKFFGYGMTKEKCFLLAAGDFRRIEFVISCISNVTLPPVSTDPSSIQLEKFDAVNLRSLDFQICCSSLISLIGLFIGRIHGWKKSFTKL